MDHKTKMTEREHSVYKFIRNIIESKGYPPTLREICAALDIKSPMTVSKCLESLENMNLITRKPNAFRGITLKEPATPKNIPLYEDKTMTRIGSVKLQNGRALLVTEDTEKKNLLIQVIK